MLDAKYSSEISGAQVPIDADQRRLPTDARRVLEERLLATISQTGCFPDGLADLHFSNISYRQIFRELAAAHAELGACDVVSFELWTRQRGWDPQAIFAAVDLMDQVQSLPAKLLDHYVMVLRINAEVAQADGPEDAVLREAQALRDAGRAVPADLKRRELEAFVRLKGAGSQTTPRRY